MIDVHRDQQATGQADGQADDINGRSEAILPEVAEGDAQVVEEHSLS
jgi:hypothetical protein